MLLSHASLGSEGVAPCEGPDLPGHFSSHTDLSFINSEATDASLDNWRTPSPPCIYTLTKYMIGTDEAQIHSTLLPLERTTLTNSENRQAFCCNEAAE